MTTSQYSGDWWYPTDELVMRNARDAAAAEYRRMFDATAEHPAWLMNITDTVIQNLLEAGMWWLGDAAGFQVQPGQMDDDLALVHRCGWVHDIDGADRYVGNLVPLMMRHREEGCQR